MSNDDLVSMNFDEQANEIAYKKFLELSQKQAELSKIKNNLKQFTSSLDNMELIKNLESKAKME
jgi:hypothetical protein